MNPDNTIIDSLYMTNSKDFYRLAGKEDRVDLCHLLRDFTKICIDKKTA